MVWNQLLNSKFKIFWINFQRRIEWKKCWNDTENAESLTSFYVKKDQIGSWEVFASKKRNTYFYQYDPPVKGNVPQCANSK